MGKNVNKLSARKVATINKAGLYGDGMGLWLKVTKSDLCEMALAHTIKSKSEAAYRRGDMIEKRRKLAEDWLKFMDAPAPLGTAG